MLWPILSFAILIICTVVTPVIYLFLFPRKKAAAFAIFISMWALVFGFSFNVPDCTTWDNPNGRPETMTTKPTIVLKTGTDSFELLPNFDCKWMNVPQPEKQK
jgi:hypothetical protein